MSYAETPDLSLDELVALSPLVNGDVSAAQDELVRRLQNRLPGLVGRRNTAHGWTGARAIPVPSVRDILPAPGALTNSHISKVLVDIEVKTSAQGAGAFKNSVAVTVSAIDERLGNAQMGRMNWGMAEAIRLCLYPFLTGCVNAQGALCWRQLEPTGYGMLREEWAKEFAGTASRFTMTMPPGMG